MKICKFCILDDTIPELALDSNGECQFCKMHRTMQNLYPSEKREQDLKNLVDKIKKSGKNKKYDCVLGASGGTDSTYTMYMAKKYGLRALVVHLDNGWNSEIAVKNIKNTCQILNYELYTHVINWEEFKSLQIAFLKASTPDAEIPTDIAIHAILVKMASKENIRYVLNGHSFRTEGIQPLGWTYMDGRYIKSVNKKFGKNKLKSFPNFSMLDLLYYNIFKGIKIIPFLNYFDYDKQIAKEIIKKEIQWIDYGGHHHENIYSKFYQSYYTPEKFKIDKRKTALSAQVREGKITRQEALDFIKHTPHSFDINDLPYIYNKLGLSAQEFEDIMKYPINSFMDYPNYYRTINKFKKTIRLLCKWGFFPEILYMKFFNEL